ncbi:hypothetical protein IU403_00600 [Aerococcaceae bacterium zg-BR22]|uniref:hypothetical protein n=1 Tax=Aerococcaceae bacterium zg-1292 TaxID=2774330 RepID=UPI0040634EB1|nr:hypothetical protein [Aerococcaceae bacterium zg-BR22]
MLVDTFEEEIVVPLNEIAREIQQVDADIEKTTKELNELLGQLVGTTEEEDAALKDFLRQFI